MKGFAFASTCASLPFASSWMRLLLLASQKPADFRLGTLQIGGGSLATHQIGGNMSGTLQVDCRNISGALLEDFSNTSTLQPGG